MARLGICLLLSIVSLVNCNKCLRDRLDPVHIPALDISKLHLVVGSRTKFTWQAARSGTTNITFWATDDVDVKTTLLSDGSFKIDSGSEFVRANFNILLLVGLGYSILRPEHGGYLLLLLGLGHLTIGFAQDADCPTNSAIHVQIPSSLVEELCVNGACQPVLCHLSTERRYSSIPSNNEIIFSDNQCTLRIPDGWNEWWVENFGNETEPDPLGDHDDDELVNILEFYGDDAYKDNFISVGGLDDTTGSRRNRQTGTTGTNPKKSDSDGDLATDGFERNYDMNPQEANDLSVDSDNDGLSDFDEMIYDTDPRNADHDGDGKTDGAEVQDGENPRNPRRPGSGGGRTGPGNPEQTVQVKLTVGDGSWSHSERYVLHVHGNEKGTPRISFQSEEWGEVDSSVYDFYNGTYKVYIQHIDSDPVWLNNAVHNPNGYADFDYTALIQKEGGDPEVEIDDPDEILGTRGANHEVAEPLYAAGKEAEMRVKIKCKSVDGVENCVNKEFLKEKEGFETKGYVPIDKTTGLPFPESGVTIGSGIDLKSKNRKYFEDLGVPKSLIDKFEPYMDLNLKGQAALDYLEEHPLTLNNEEAEAMEPVSNAVMTAEIKRIEILYNNEINRLDKGLKCFDMLTDAQRTVVSSVYFQYGSPGSAPKFWGYVTNQDWAAAERELRNFGDKHGTRRRSEADLLKNDSGKNSCD